MFRQILSTLRSTFQATPTQNNPALPFVKVPVDLAVDTPKQVAEALSDLQDIKRDLEGLIQEQDIMIDNIEPNLPSSSLKLMMITNNVITDEQVKLILTNYKTQQSQEKSSWWFFAAYYPADNNVVQLLSNIMTTDKERYTALKDYIQDNKNAKNPFYKVVTETVDMPSLLSQVLNHHTDNMAILKAAHGIH